MAPLRWGICSAGRMSNKFMVGLRTLSETDHQVVAVAARSESAAAQFAESHGIPSHFGSYAELASCSEVDIIYVANIHPKHYETVMMMFEAGKPVLCEKPLTMNASDTKKLIQAARDKGVFFMEAVWMRFFPAMVELRRQIAQGILGDIKLVQVAFGFRADKVPDRLAQPELGGGAVLDLGVYCINLATMVFGEKPEKIQANGSLLDTGVDETVAMTLSYSGGRFAQLTCSSNLELSKEAVVYGTKGSIKVLAPFWCPTQLQTPEGALNFPLPPSKGPPNPMRRSEGLSYEAAAVRDCLSKNLKESEVMTLEHTAMVAEIMDEVVKQVHASADK